MIFNHKNTPIHYSSIGEGPVWVLLHGFLESSKMWDPLLPSLSENRKIITIDLPGHGKSGVIAKTHSMELMAEIVREIMVHLQIPVATFVGHSMGGYVALAFAEMFSGNIDKILLLNSTTIADSDERKKNRDRAIEIMDKNPRAFISMAISNWTAEIASKDIFKEELERYKNLAYTFPVEGIIAALRGMRDRNDRTGILKSFSGPKFMLFSEADPIIPLAENLRLAKKCDVAATVIAGGHLSVIENLPSVRKFLLSI